MSWSLSVSLRGRPVLRLPSSRCSRTCGLAREVLFGPRQEHVVKGGGLNPQGALEHGARHGHNAFGLRFHPPILPYPMTFAGGLLVLERGLPDARR